MYLCMNLLIFPLVMLQSQVVSCYDEDLYLSQKPVFPGTVASSSSSLGSVSDGTRIFTENFSIFVLQTRISSRSACRSWTSALKQVSSAHCGSRRGEKKKTRAAELLFTTKLLFQFLQLFHRGHCRLWASSWAATAPEPCCDWRRRVARATAASSSVPGCSRWRRVARATGTSNGGSRGRG